MTTSPLGPSDQSFDYNKENVKPGKASPKKLAKNVTPETEKKVKAGEEALQNIPSSDKAVRRKNIKGKVIEEGMPTSLSDQLKQKKLEKVKEPPAQKPRLETIPEKGTSMASKLANLKEPPVEKKPKLKSIPEEE